MNETSIQVLGAASRVALDSNVAIAERRAQRPPSAREAPETRASAQAAPDETASIVRWLPLVLPLFAALMACDAYAIVWAVVAQYP